MPQLHINHVRNQVEIEYHLNMFISAFRTDAAGDPAFTYEDLLAYFLHFPTSPQETASFGEIWWKLQVDAEQIMSGKSDDSERFHQCERPDFFGDSPYLEFVVHGDGTNAASIKAADVESIEDFGGTGSSEYAHLMRSLKYVVNRAKEDAGYFPVSSWYVTFSSSDGDKDWNIWFLAGCEKGKPPRWSPYSSRNQMISSKHQVLSPLTNLQLVSMSSGITGGGTPVNWHAENTSRLRLPTMKSTRRNYYLTSWR